jgi:hypothetical protein
VGHGTNGFNILGDRGLSNENTIVDVRDTGGHTHVILNNDKLTAMILSIGRRAIFRFKGQGAWDDDNAHSSSIPASERMQVMNRMAPIGAILYTVNEPTGAYEQLATWTLEALDECNRLGRKACIFNFAVGNPSDTTLELLKPVAEFAYEHGHIVGWHEYRNPSDDNGYIPDGHYDIGRFLSGRRIWGAKCPEIVITELGVTVNYKDSAGYRTIWTDEQMGEAIQAWTRFYASHGVKVCHYAYGGQGDPKWDSFEVKYPAIQKSITEANQLEITVTQTSWQPRRIVPTGNFNVNIRASASANATIVGRVPAGGVVADLDTNTEWSGEWHRIRLDGVVGFVSAAFVNVERIPDPPVQPPVFSDLPVAELLGTPELRRQHAQLLRLYADYVEHGAQET